ncbi:hypothetical protein [Streptomyces xiaopingdaonensis]|uniref:hypothetical protein n=1 Tax=Streptomyces xiaopingdaonensis TaxID=1565415 RepID=UPI0002EA32F7|nr:hypothetical protein [Streptomyces xiaopingdaonensis]
MVSVGTSVFAVLVSLGSLVLAYTSSRRARMPVLQFVWEESGGGEPRWCLVNVGSGPATNVVVAQTVRTALRRGLGEERWFNPVLVPSIPAGGRLPLSWLGSVRGVGYGFGASYTDAERYFFTTKCGDDVSMFFVGLHMPRWPLLSLDGGKAVRAWWGVGRPTGPEWSAVTARHVRRRWWLARRFGVCRRMGGWADPVLDYRER